MKGEVTILAAGQVHRLLQECASELVPYIVICAFAGLRPTEAASLDWGDIHLDSGQIEVKARHSKTRRHRLVPIQPNLKAWLEIYRKEFGAITFSRRKFRDAYRKAGFAEWPLDVLRHSFGTYRLPILKSAESLALEMGNSPDVIFRHYRWAMDEETAGAYFSIQPRDRFRPALRVISNLPDKPLSEEFIHRERRDTPALLDADRREAT
ncbi:MAG: tyrosine-type recombinase/integrase [Verrucomicrobiota bacterium]|nr:tyrosine-type recombinase/integrase [Verrucomicrobiota bacterium]